MISFLWYENSQKVTRTSQNLLKVLPKTVLFRSIMRFWAYKKPHYLENHVVREPCKRSSACTRVLLLKIHILWYYWTTYFLLWGSWQLGKSLCLDCTPIGYWGLHRGSFRVEDPWDIHPSSRRLHNSKYFPICGSDLDRFHQRHFYQWKFQLEKIIKA